jgi:Mg2+ and Co2+ transporter CorA
MPRATLEQLIQHLNAQNVMAMWEQAKKSGLDAVVMKIITVIAVIYLPATFVAVRVRQIV